MKKILYLMSILILLSPLIVSACTLDTDCAYNEMCFESTCVFCPYKGEECYYPYPGKCCDNLICNPITSKCVKCYDTDPVKESKFIKGECFDYNNPDGFQDSCKDDTIHIEYMCTFQPDQLCLYVEMTCMNGCDIANGVCIKGIHGGPCIFDEDCGIGLTCEAGVCVECATPGETRCRFGTNILDICDETNHWVEEQNCGALGGWCDYYSDIHQCVDITTLDCSTLTICEDYNNFINECNTDSCQDELGFPGRTDDDGFPCYYSGDTSECKLCSAVNLGETECSAYDNQDTCELNPCGEPNLVPGIVTGPCEWDSTLVECRYKQTITVNGCEFKWEGTKYSECNPKTGKKTRTGDYNLVSGDPNTCPSKKPVLVLEMPCLVAKKFPFSSPISILIALVLLIGYYIIPNKRKKQQPL